MNRLSGLDGSTIAAVATAPGRGGIGIVRISGDAAAAIGAAITGLAMLQPRHAHFARFSDADGATLDTGIALYFPGPHSFTGEDVVELQGHGGPVVLDQVLQLACKLGARPARAGEFSERAYLNDKIDLAQAEAIADLINSSTEQAAINAARSLQGEFSRKVETLIEHVTRLRVYVEASIDFPEEEIDFIQEGQVTARLRELIRQVDIAFLDGTFFENGEIPGRDMSEIPHPFIEESLNLFADLPEEERAKVHFIHFNHTNPALEKAGVAARRVREAGCRVAEEGMSIRMGEE